MNRHSFREVRRTACRLCVLLLFALGGLFNMTIAASHVQMGAYFHCARSRHLGVRMEAVEQVNVRRRGRRVPMMTRESAATRPPRDHDPSGRLESAGTFALTLAKLAVGVFVLRVPNG